jgi:glucuronate isomerase
MGATATDHAAETPFTTELSPGDVNALFGRALAATATEADARAFTGHMLMEMARMSVDDGLVMQIHVGSLRDYNNSLFQKFGQNVGADIPINTEFTRHLRPLLEKFGSNPRLSLIIFTLDEATYSRELAPLAGHFPALRLGPPWWFYDSFNGIRRYFDLVMETAGLYNTVGFNDDTRAFPSISARHDLWRRSAADWLAGLVVRNIVDEEDAASMMESCAYGLAKESYHLA